MVTASAGVNTQQHRPAFLLSDYLSKACVNAIRYEFVARYFIYFFVRKKRKKNIRLRGLEPSTSRLKVILLTDCATKPIPYRKSWLCGDKIQFIIDEKRTLLAKESLVRPTADHVQYLLIDH